MIRKTVESLTWYDDPERIYKMMVGSRGWDYQINKVKLGIRDLALMSVLYIATARITEVVGGTVRIQGRDMKLDPITKDQFIIEEDNLWLRRLPIIKQKFVKRGSRWVMIQYPDEYPTRVDIPFFRSEGPINKFTDMVLDHLDTVPEGEPVFNIGRRRAHQVVTSTNPDWFPHYFRDMGLKFWKRYFENDAFKLKKFSGHKRWSSLENYMGEELFNS